LFRPMSFFDVSFAKNFALLRSPRRIKVISLLVFLSVRLSICELDYRKIVETRLVRRPFEGWLGALSLGGPVLMTPILQTGLL